MLHQYKRTVKKVLAAAGLLAVMYGINGCKKLVTIDQPIASVTTPETFSSNTLALSALAGVYSQLMTNSGQDHFANALTTIYGGLSADELETFSGTTIPTDYQFYSNTLIRDNPTPGAAFWTPAYKIIYSVNGIIEGVAASTVPALDDTARAQCTGEAKFVRALCYFYLTNMFGDVPLVLTTDFRKTASMHRTPQADVYKQMILDLQDAISLTRADYSVSHNERIRANKYAAAALLARVYLYQGDWANAEKQADSVINNSQYSLVSDLNGVFLKNSQETILQFQQNPARPTVGAVLTETKVFMPQLRLSQVPQSDWPIYLDSAFFTPYAAIFIPQYYLTPQLASAFEPGDKRRTTWIDSVPSPSTSPFFSRLYYYSCKYPDQSLPAGAAPNRYYTVLRLAEQYLIRAEARAQQNNLGGAAADLNMVRTRSGLPNTTAATKDALLAAVLHERQTELFTEWGHRWLDLKRTGKASQVLGVLPNKQPWQPYQLLYPINPQEIRNDPNIIQNPGY